MAERKYFSELSERQKRRRVNASCKDTFRLINTAFSHLETDHEENKEVNEFFQNNQEIQNIDFTCIDDYFQLDYLTAEFNKLVQMCENDNLEVSSTDSGSSDDDEDRENKATDIQYRLANLISYSNYPDIHANSLLGILRDAGLHYLPKDVRSLRNTPRKTVLKSCPPGEYFHYGLRAALESCINKFGDVIGKNIEIDVNIDGLPITKSPPAALWPILGKIVHESCNEVFLIGCYHGREKPKSVETYLNQFIDEFNELYENGFIHKGRQYFVKIRCLVCDSPAASYVLCIKQFNGYYGCRKCTIKGDWASRVIYSFEDKPLRTDVSFRTRVQPEHHNGISPLVKLKFDMVQQVPLDYMHLVCLGVTKQLLKLWIKPRTVPNLNILQLDSLSNSFVSLSPYIPKEFARKPQTLIDLGHWKATTFRLFLLYAGPIILQNILPEEYMAHFNVLSCAIRILCHPTLHCEYNEYARELLVYFVRKFKVLYEENGVTWNMHNLIHIAGDSKLFGPLDDYSAFPFENYMQTIKRMLRKREQPLQQLHRRLTEKSGFIQKQNRTDKNQFPVMCQPAPNKTLPNGCHSGHRSLRFSNFELKDARPNNCCITEQNQIVVIERICKEKNEDVIVGREFLSKDDLPNYPLESSEMGICEVKCLSEKKIISVKNIRNKGCLFLHDGRSYVVPLLHHN